MSFKITFKKQKRETGLAGVGSGSRTTMKVNGRPFGYIKSPSWSDKFKGWRVMFRVEADNDIGFNWVRLKKHPATEPEARLLAQEVIPQMTLYKLSYYEEE